MKHFIALPVLILAFCGISQEKAVSGSDKAICPVCKTAKNTIPVVYGKPAAATIKKAEKGEVRLGGCVIGENTPKHYCKKDKVEF